MKRSWSILLAGIGWSLLVVAGCNKPSEESCRKALANMRQLIGTDNAVSNADTAGDVRRCKGGSSKKAVECAANAKTLDELRACDFMTTGKEPAAASGSAAPGSAAPGSAAPGSAAPGSAASGSAAPGSAAPGSAAPGSAAPGSAAPGAEPADPAAPAAGSGSAP